MEIDYIKMHMVIERYVQGKLTDDEEADFEERLVWDQELQEEVELAETLRSWFHASAKETKYSMSEQGGTLRWMPDFLLNPGYAAAASLVLGMLITFSVLQGPNTEIGFSIDESVPSLIVPLLATRSANSNLQQIPVRSGAVTLLLIDVPDSNQRFNVVVRNSTSGDAVWKQDGLSAGYLEAVAVGIAGNAVPPGDYILAIEPTDAGAGFRQEIRFKTVASE